MSLMHINQCISSKAQGAFKLQSEKYNYTCECVTMCLRSHRFSVMKQQCAFMFMVLL